MRRIDFVEIVVGSPGTVFEVMEQGSDTVGVVTVTMYMVGV